MDQFKSKSFLVTGSVTQEKESELEKLSDIDKKYKELKVKFKKLEAKKTVTKPAAKPATGGGADPEEVKSLKKKVGDLEKKLADGFVFCFISVFL